ncbi:MAG: SH3 domain-containing protein [Sphingomonadales bacterium]|jgi:hypothetical protein|nr:SH3 domain-containing protein [Sphingomonadales bacterium]
MPTHDALWGMRIALLAALAAMTLPAAARAERLPPRDECVADASFAAFRTTLKGIVARKDAKALLALTAPNIEYSLDVGIPGKAGFAKEWDLVHPAASNLWVELDQALSLGCALDRGEASIPYMYARLPQSRDTFATTLPSRSRVNLRASPNTDSPVVALLDWDVLTVIDEQDSSWTHVKTDEGKEGYVRVDFLRNPLAYRAIFRKRDGKWMMAIFINGD